MAITRRYVHPQEETIRAAIEKARGAEGGHSGDEPVPNSDADFSLIK